MLDCQCGACTCNSVQCMKCYRALTGYFGHKTLRHRCRNDTGAEMSQAPKTRYTSAPVPKCDTGSRKIRDTSDLGQFGRDANFVVPKCLVAEVSGSRAKQACSRVSMTSLWSSIVLMRSRDPSSVRLIPVFDRPTASILTYFFLTWRRRGANGDLSKAVLRAAPCHGIRFGLCLEFRCDKILSAW